MWNILNNFVKLTDFSRQLDICGVMANLSDHHLIRVIILK